MTDEIIARLDAVALKTGIPRATLIKLLIDTFLRHFEKHGKAGLPLNWEELLLELDGRTRESRRITQFPPRVPDAAALNEAPPVSSKKGVVSAKIAKKTAQDAAKHHDPKSSH